MSASSPSIQPNSNFVSARISPARSAQLGSRRGRAPASAPRAGGRDRRRPCPPAASRVMFSSWPTSALVDGVKIGSGSCSASRSPSRQQVRHHRAAAPVLRPARAGEVAAHHALGIDPLGPAHQHRAAGELGRRAAAGGQVRRIGREEVASGPGRASRSNHQADSWVSSAALVGDRLVEDHVEGRQAIGRHQQQPVVADGVGLAHLAAMDERQPLDVRLADWVGHGVMSRASPSGSSAASIASTL